MRATPLTTSILQLLCPRLDHMDPTLADDDDFDDEDDNDLPFSEV